MKLSESALAILKNFSTINDSIVFYPGSTISTVTEGDGIFAEAEVEDVFPVEFGIYDLSNFLGNISALNDPDLTFEEKTVILDDGTFRMSYRGVSPTLITSPPQGKTVRMPDPDVTFDLSKETLLKILKLAAMNGLNNLSVVGEAGTIHIRTQDVSNPDSASVSTPVGTFSGEDFVAVFKTENLKMLPDDYVVSLKKGFFAQFVSKTRKLSYSIGMDVKK